MTDYRSHLKEVLAERCRVNPRYSLRAFARDLGISPSVISEVLNGKHGLSEQKALVISKKLGFSPEEEKRFLALVKASDSRSRTDRDEALKFLSEKITENDKTVSLTLDAFRIISDSHHYTLIEYLQLPKKSHCADDLGRALGLSEHIIRESLSRLERLEMIVRKQDRYRVLTPVYTSPTGIPSEAIRNFHKQILEKATQSLTLQTLDQREFRTLTFAVQKKKIPELKTRIQKFVRDINEETVLERQKDTVYCLSVQLFEMTPGEKP